MKIHFKSGVVEIKLIRNKFVDSWLDTVSNLDPISTWNENVFPEVTMPQAEVDQIRNKYSAKFDAHVDELKLKYNINFPGKMGSSVVSQQRLNQLHMWITHGAFTKTNWELPNASLESIIDSKWNHWQNYNPDKDHTPEFVVPQDTNADVTRILFEMNCDIHWYEETVNSPRVNELRAWGYDINDGRHIIQRYTSGKDTAFDVFEIDNTLRSLCTYDTEPDLWLPFAVLGKEYYTCWVNMDNPAQFDITNIDKTYCPGWELQPNSMTVEVLKHPEFQKWLIDHGVPTDPFCIGKIPLGTCTNKADIDWDSVLQEPVLRVEWK